MHKKIIEKALAALDTERAAYFGTVATLLENDNRTHDKANLVYSVLKDVMAHLPIYLEERELVNQLFDFTDSNYQSLKKALYDPKFISDPASLKTVTNTFVHQIVSVSLEKHENGEFEDIKLSEHQYSWPYRDTDIVDRDDDPEGWEEALEKNQQWLEKGGVDRRSPRTPMIDEIAKKKIFKPKKT